MREAAFDSSVFRAKDLATLLICTLGFGWFASNFVSRYFISEHMVLLAVPVVLLAVASLTLAVVGIIRLVRPTRIPWKSSIAVLFFTMFVGISGLLLFQTVAEHSGSWKFGPFGKARGFVVILKIIGWSYESMDSPNLFQRLFGFIFGVGFCEEVVKTLPLLYFVFSGPDKKPRVGFRELLVIAFFSGLGFGTGEALYLYSPWGISPGFGEQIIRWFACVPSHAIYTVIDAAFLWALAPTIRSIKGPYLLTGAMALVVFTVAVIHGVYNTFSYYGPLGLALDALSVFVMLFVIRLVAHGSEIEGEAPPIPQTHRSRVPRMFSTRAGTPSFARLYAGAAAFCIIALFFTKSEDYYRMMTTPPEEVFPNLFSIDPWIYGQ